MKLLLSAMLLAVAVAVPLAGQQVYSPIEDGLVLPAVISRVAPDYTREAWDLRIQGSVWLEATVLANGTVDDVTVSKSLDKLYGLDENAVEAAKRWTFRPGMKDGKPVPVRVSLDMRFTLAKGPRP